MESGTITKEDLKNFKRELLYDIDQLLRNLEIPKVKPWLKNSEVRRLLSISSNTLQRLRISGKLPSRKVGGIHFYQIGDIENLLNNGVD